ncbi:hypothetical protein GCM10017788_12580 [Amycolatopsis acidiphila]|nr:hypothetical protein GCM10017788_12580 [Amycolatopsis acidiphila]
MTSLESRVKSLPARAGAVDVSVNSVVTKNFRRVREAEGSATRAGDTARKTCDLPVQRPGTGESSEE